MKKRYHHKIILPLMILAALPLHASESVDELELKMEAASIVKKFGGALKPKLLAAIQAGGFEHAIEICAIEAPQIASSLSKETGWNVRRVSLKPRNAENAAPNIFEQEVLLQFDERQIDGELASNIDHDEIVGEQYRFMKAQAVEGVCLNCHGDSVTPSVMEAISNHYPGDIATGYSLGQVRGAFSLTKDL